MEPAARHATYQDVLDAPEHVVAELIAGELYTSPRPAPRHSVASSIIGGDLTGPFHRRPDDPNGPGGWWILDEPELHFGGDVLVPDLAGWRRERLPRIPNEAAFTLAPDWLCEVVSPSTARIDRVLKMPIYAREGVEFVWIVDPRLKTLEVFQRSAASWILLSSHVGDDLCRAEPFAAVELDMTRWWVD